MKINGFLKTCGNKIFDENGKEVLLRGMGLGNWLLAEGYMWRFFTKCDRPRRIENLINELVGEEKSKEFWKSYRENYITELDIKKISEEGLNSIRLPINYRVIFDCESEKLIPEGIKLVDKVIEWCTRYNIYVILDLHGAPGGQTGTNIDDSKDDIPELFIDDNNRRLTIKLWHDIAYRYRNNPIVGGYDLLNEPLPNWFCKYNDMVMPLYREITEEIRKVDKNHMIILEGVNWSTDWSIFKELKNKSFDDNYMIQFHKYWNNPDIESIEPFLKFRRDLNVPIFMGESGENNKSWYTGVFQMCEDLNISWNFWVYKKMDNSNSLCSINTPDNWSMILEYVNSGVEIDKNKAWEILKEYLSNIKFENCKYNEDVLKYIFRYLPVKIPAEYYGYKGLNKDYYVKELCKNNSGLRISDGTCINLVEKKGELNFKHYNGEEKKENEKLYLKLSSSEWVKYKVNFLNDNNVKIKLRIMAEKDNTSVSININNGRDEIINIKSLIWQEVTVSYDSVINNDSNNIKLKCKSGCVRIESILIFKGE
ncbi:MAG: glycoside hydrolase family 5 protein [Clostridiaceae bacterium]